MKLAVGLFIESESADRAKEVQWSADLFDGFIDESLCEFVIDHTEAHEGVLRHRRAVAVSFFSQWARNLRAGRGPLAAVMLRYLIRIGSELTSKFRNDGADFKACFEAVLDICERRPEFRSGIREDLADVLARRIGDAGYWTGDEVALRLATQCAPVFTKEGLEGVVRSVVALLKKTAPSDGNWIIVKPAIRFLAEECVGELAEQNREFGSEIVREVLRFNSDESAGTYAADILFALNRYPPFLLHSEDIGKQFKPVVDLALEKASAINASSAVNNMMALLVVPRAGGREAITRVLQVLSRVLDSAISRKPVLSFAPAYFPVRYLVAYRSDICKESTLRLEELDRLLFELCGKLKEIWAVAIEQPSIFAPLAFLRSQPADRATVDRKSVV